MIIYRWGVPEMLLWFNTMWAAYKKRYMIKSDILLDEVKFDAPEGTEACFDLMEMLAGRYILHVTKRIHLYKGDYVEFLLDHEFTHLADFIAYPYEKPTIYYLGERARDEDNVNTAADKNIFGEYGKINLPRKTTRKELLSEDIGKRLFDYMNTYSEFHACQRALGRILPGPAGRSFFDVEKAVIPAPYKYISVRRMLSDNLRKAHAAYQKFAAMLVPQVFAIYFRYVMYLFGYVSYYGNDIDVLRQTFEVLEVADKEELYLAMYQALKDKDIEKILDCAGRIYQDSYLPFVKEYIRRHYDAGLYSEEELDEITPDNYHDFLETLANRKGGRIWSGRVSPVYGVHDVDKAYGAVDVETIKELIEKNRKLPCNQMKPDFAP